MLFAVCSLSVTCSKGQGLDSGQTVFSAICSVFKPFLFFSQLNFVTGLEGIQNNPRPSSRILGIAFFTFCIPIKPCMKFQHSDYPVIRCQYSLYRIPLLDRCSARFSKRDFIILIFKGYSDQILMLDYYLMVVHLLEKRI